MEAMRSDGVAGTRIRSGESPIGSEGISLAIILDYGAGGVDRGGEWRVAREEMKVSRRSFVRKISSEGQPQVDSLSKEENEMSRLK